MLNNQLITHPIEIIGTIVSIPHQNKNNSRFEFLIEKYHDNNLWYSTHFLSRLSWYQNPFTLKAGERWKLKVHLKKPRGLANFAGFDYESWLVQHGIVAVGNVLSNQNNTRIKAFVKYYALLRLRQNLAEKIDNLTASSKESALIKALTVGVRDNINQQQWELFRATGTNHLMAIAGLHIGMLVSIFYFIIFNVARSIPSLSLKIPAPQIAFVGMLIAAFIYAALAGFSIPTERALIMLMVLVVTQLLKRPIVSWRAISIALFLVVLKDPLVSFDAGFYLSFIAVSFIAYRMQQRLHLSHGLWQHGRLQLIVTLGLMPLTLWFFQIMSWSSIFANAITIPWVGWILLPLSLIALPLLFISPPIAKLFLLIAQKNLLWLMEFLKIVTNVFGQGWQYTIPEAWILIPCIIGIILLLAPSGWPARWQSLLLFFPLFFVKAKAPGTNEVWFTLLDVGQGLAAVVQTKNHVLLYDAGPMYSENFDTGFAVVLPYLSQQNIRMIDALVVSHGDNDHKGGVNSVLKSLQVKKIYTSVPQQFLLPITQPCYQHQQWQWDGAQFEFLHPASYQTLTGNNLSCVLRITVKNKHILLTGDIEQAAEKLLLVNIPNKLPADILIAPHHGSKTSSSDLFVKTIKPKITLFATGYLNRYHFPSMKIIHRYLDNRSIVMNTAIVGAVRIELNDKRDAKIIYARESTNKKGSFMLPLAST